MSSIQYSGTSSLNPIIPFPVRSGVRIGMAADSMRRVEIAIGLAERIAAEKLVAEKLAATKAGAEAPPIATPVGKRPPTAAVTVTKIAAEEAKNIA